MKKIYRKPEMEVEELCLPQILETLGTSHTTQQDAKVSDATFNIDQDDLDGE